MRRNPNFFLVSSCRRHSLAPPQHPGQRAQHQRSADGGQAEGTDFAFRWSVPKDKGGDKITDYHFTLANRQDMRWPLSTNFDKLISRTADKGKAQYVLPSTGLLTGGKTYYWRVRAKDGLPAAVGRNPDGFVDRELVIPVFVLQELQRVADSTDPQRRARGVHRDVAAAQDRHVVAAQDGRVLLGEAVRAHEVGARQVLVGRVDAVQVLAGDVDEVGEAGAGRDVDRVESLVEEVVHGERLSDDGVELELDSHFREVVHLGLDDVLGQAEFGDAVDEDAARLVEGLEHDGLVAEPAQITRIKIGHTEQALHTHPQLFGVGCVFQARLLGIKPGEKLIIVRVKDQDTKPHSILLLRTAGAKPCNRRRTKSSFASTSSTAKPEASGSFFSE